MVTDITTFSGEVKVVNHICVVL